MADLVGTRLGQYQILERISRGGSSTVYKAYHAKLNRLVAVKVLSPHFIDEEGFLERFQREAQAVARLDHPNILPVYDYEQTSDVVYIVMRYINTGTLRDMMTAPLDVRDTMEIITQVGLALGYAHKQGVIHRDVKPGNILIGEGRWALLTDFGLAKIKGGGYKVTQTGVGVGTPDYMSPEQAQGLPVDGRADLYSLGATMYEMLTGQTPFDGDEGMAILIKHITEPVKPPREINPNIPLAVQEVIMKALSKDPNQRFQTAESMVAAFAHAVGPIGGRAANVPVNINQAAARAQTAAAHTLSATTTPIPSHPLRDRFISSGRDIFSKVDGTLRSRWRTLGIVLIAIALIALVFSSLQRQVAIGQTLTPVANVPDVTVTGGVTPNNIVAALDSTDIVTSNGASLAGMATVPGGSFTMGATGSNAKPDETPAHEVSLAGYYIDLSEVTNLQFTRFVTTTDYKTDAERSNDAVTWRTFNTPDRQLFPVVYVSWNDAASYCDYVGKRLPTEAEWEYAARGNTRHAYPWGDVFNAQAADTIELSAGQPVAIGSHSLPSPFGLYDMSGNVWEWVNDWYAADYYASGVSVDPSGPGSGIQKVIRGGSFRTKGQDALTTVREPASIDSRTGDIGFRCALSP